MTFANMTSEEWEEVRKYHDAMVQMGKLELQSEEIRECRPAGSFPRTTKPVERELHELDDVVVGIQH